MFKSKDEAYLQPSNFKCRSCGKWFPLNSFIKCSKIRNETNCSIFVGIKFHLIKHLFTNLPSSIFVLEIGNGLVWYG